MNYKFIIIEKRSYKLRLAPSPFYAQTGISIAFYMPLTTCWLLLQPVWPMESKNEIVFPASNTLEENARLWAEHYNGIVEPGHGLFIDFKKTPEFGKVCIEYITKHFGWVLERPYFIRKPEK